MQMNLSGDTKKPFFYGKIYFVAKSCGVVTPHPHDFYHYLDVDLTQQPMWIESIILSMLE